ncbi:low density lipoprotein receptor adaptor protein 1 [Nesidiocoris tenuis]|uniref:Low density lipoprotein receptor adaptor protein 1 n=1 Tax=Nesidiocoris tenuis TaxID=355587 RepID=A0ABN7BIK9_9HEMI|nr:low density lipoprotein receptor adaptor protein 1 [Nesidiocoris tenuis]
MAFLKTLWRHGSKHEKLSDEWDLTPRKKGVEMEMEQPGSTLEGITFNVKYLGTTKVSCPSSSKATADAIKKIVNQAKTFNRKPRPVQLGINLRGVSVVDAETKDRLHDVSLYRISYCSADATHGHVFAYIASADDDTLHCYAFLCPKRKTAQLISITVAQTFNTAFHLWQMTNSNTGALVAPSSPKNSSLMSGCISSSGNRRKDSVITPRERSGTLGHLLTPIPMLIDLTTPIEEENPNAHPEWTSFED